VSAKKKKPGAPAGARRDEQGRAHLVIHGDPRGGHRLTLSAPMFNDAWQDEVALGAASTAHALLAAGHTLENAVALGRKAMAGTSTIVEGLLSRSPDQAPACRSGCAHCCHQAVGVSAPEVFAIHDHLRATRSATALAAITQHIRDADDETRGLSSTERLSPAHPCPFLDREDARCSIYEVRPLPCRGTNSLDADACAEVLDDPTARAAFLAGKRPIPCFVEPIRAFHAVAAGMQLALDEVHGLEVLPLELTAAMRILLDDPEGTPAAWLAGRDPFKAARGGDNSNNPGSTELSGRRSPP
jgi:Fe-S-cluster containining protein